MIDHLTKKLITSQEIRVLDAFLKYDITLKYNDKWREFLVPKILSASNGNDDIALLLIKYYKNIISSTLIDSDNYQDKKMELLKSASDDLWKFLAYENDKIRNSARYALAITPKVVEFNEGRVIKILNMMRSKYRLEVIKLISHIQEGIFPEIDKIVAAKNFAQNYEERNYLDLRIPRVKRSVGMMRCNILFNNFIKN